MKGIPANDYFMTPRAKYDRIQYRFVSDDRNTPSSCAIRIGDTDPLTGERITNVDLFEEYNKMGNRQVYKNLKAVKIDLTPEEKRHYDEEKKTIIAEFEEKYGYTPHRDDIRYLLEERWPKTYLLSVHELINNDGQSKADQHIELCEPAPDPLGEYLPDDIFALRELVNTFTDRQKDIYEALLVQFSGGQVKTTMTELADKWGVSVTRICQERDSIWEKIKKAINPD